MQGSGGLAQLGYRAAVLVCLVYAGHAQALIVASGNGNDNEASVQAVYPVFPYWGNIGQIGNGTGIYLGGDLVLSARHVGAQGGGFILDGTDHPMAPLKTLLNPTDIPGTLTTKTDLRIYQLDPGHGLDLTLTTVDLATSLPTIAGDELVMIGTGFIADNPGGPPPFIWSATRDTLWGQNKVFSVFDGNADPSDPHVLTLNNRDVITFTTRFDNPDTGPPSTRGLTHEAQAALHDSGGAVFFKDADTWKLTGLIHAIEAVVVGEAAYGDKTFISDLPLYADQILSTMFVPGDLNQDFAIDDADIDLLYAEINSGMPEPAFDLNGDTSVNQLDVDFLVRNILNTEFGDANLDRLISFSDFSDVQSNFALAGGWADGNFNGDALITFADFAMLQSNFGFDNTAPAAPGAVPEPATLMLLTLGGAALMRRRPDNLSQPL